MWSSQCIIIFQKCKSLEPLVPVLGEIDICVYRLFCRKFNSEQVLHSHFSVESVIFEICINEWKFSQFLHYGREKCGRKFPKWGQKKSKILTLASISRLIIDVAAQGLQTRHPICELWLLVGKSAIFKFFHMCPNAHNILIRVINNIKNRETIKIRLSVLCIKFIYIL